MRPVLTALVFVASAIFFSVSATAATSEAPLTPAIDQCIRNNAAKVEETIADLNQALGYLVDGVCGAQITAEYERVLELREKQRRADFLKMCEQSKAVTAEQSKGAQTPNPFCNPAMMDTTTDTSSSGEDVRAFGMQPRSAAAISLAAQLLLDLRAAHKNSKSQ